MIPILRSSLLWLVFPTRGFPNPKPGFFQLPNPGILKIREMLLYSNISGSDNTKVEDWRV